MLRALQFRSNTSLHFNMTNKYILRNPYSCFQRLFSINNRTKPYHPNGITIVKDRQTARRVARELLELTDHIHACDTETEMFNDKYGIIGHNIPVICASIYAGEDLNFGTGPIVWIGKYIF